MQQQAGGVVPQAGGVRGMGASTDAYAQLQQQPQQQAAAMQWGNSQQQWMQAMAYQTQQGWQMAQRNLQMQGMASGQDRMDSDWRAYYAQYMNEQQRGQNAYAAQQQAGGYQNQQAFNYGAAYSRVVSSRTTPELLAGNREVRKAVMPGEGGSTDAPPPPSGLGNFKGVMLCNRPSDDSKVVSEAKQPFRSAVAYTSDLGLTPVRNFEPTVKKRGPSAALRRHVRWLRELQQQMREDRDQAEQEGQDEEEKRQKMKAAFDKHRKAVRDMMKERDDKQKEENHLVQAKAKATENSVPLSEIAHAAAISAVDRPAPKVSKPLWAMTEQEKDHFEEEEADDLINFVEHLDFDKYVGDLEFRQALGALKDRTGKLKKEQDARLGIRRLLGEAKTQSCYFPGLRMSSWPISTLATMMRMRREANFEFGSQSQRSQSQASTAAGSAKLED
eukprot:g24419.t1